MAHMTPCLMWRPTLLSDPLLASQLSTQKARELERSGFGGLYIYIYSQREENMETIVDRV